LPATLFLALAMLSCPAEASPAKTLPGHYYLSDMREVGSELLLREDGRFKWMLSYGAVDQMAEGHWTIDGNRVTLIAEAPSASGPVFQLGEKGPWGERVVHFLERRREAEAIQKRASNCPLKFFSEEDADDAVSSRLDDSKPTLSEIVAEKARIDEMQRQVQVTLNRLASRVGWQQDEGLVANTDAELSEYHSRLSSLRGDYDQAKMPGGEPPPLVYPQECRLDDWEKEAAAFRGTALHIFDVDRYTRGDGVTVEATYDNGSTITDVVAGGYAFFPIAAGRRITTITLRLPGGGKTGGEAFPVDLKMREIQLVNANLGGLIVPPFERMALTANADGSLTPEDMLRGVYRKAD
jgi:hypothetical protein